MLMTRHLLKSLALTTIACAAITASAQTTPAADNLIICDEGNYQSDNGQLSYYDAKTGSVTNSWFRTVNGTKLGDTPNDIIQINDTLIAIAVNTSNFIQFIRPDGTACGAIEDIPNNRRMCADPSGHLLYVTSYAHECGTKKFTKGYVAMIDVASKKVVATCEVGWEPEGIRFFEGKLYIANTGGYSFSEQHNYESTIQIVDAYTMRDEGTVDTGCINLYGEMSQAGQYLCINSAGDYYDNKPKTVIFDCRSRKGTIFDFPATYNTTDGRLFYTIGSEFSYNTYTTTWFFNTIDPSTMQVTKDIIYNQAVTDGIRKLATPYEIYISPYTKNIYFTDAGSYTSAGDLYGYTSDGRQLIDAQELYINPAHILALPPDGSSFTGIDAIHGTSHGDEYYYDLSGRRTTHPVKGIYIHNGKKVIIK